MENMRDSGVKWIGDIPSHWEIKFLHQVVSCVKNKNLDLAEKNLLSLSYGKIKRKDINTNEGLLPLSFENYNVIEKGDIVLRLTDLQNDHTSLRVGRAEEKGIITSAYTTLRPFDINYSKYLYYLLHSFDIKKGFYGMGSGVRQGLGYDELKNSLVLVPPLAEQTAIAKYLDKVGAQIDDIVEETKKSAEDYKKLRLSVISEAVTCGLDKNAEMKESGIEWIGKVPKGWKVIKIKQVGKTSSGATPSRSKEFDYFENASIPWIKTLDLNDSNIFESSEKITQEALNKSSCSIMPIDTVCVAMYGGAGTIGKCGQLKIQAATNQAICSIVCNEKIFSNFLLYHLIAIRQYWMYYALGTRKDPNINQNVVSEMKIILPPLPEQKAIAEYLDKKCAAIDEIIAEKENLITDLELYKKSLIYETVTGKRKV